MIKNHVMLTGVREAAALVNTTIGFLWARQHVIHLRPLEETSTPGYVWKNVFLNKSRQP